MCMVIMMTEVSTSLSAPRKSPQPTTLPPTILPQTMVLIEAESEGTGPWRQVAGPGQVLFVTPSRPKTFVRFPVPGRYRLSYGGKDYSFDVKDGASVISDRTYWVGNTWGNSGWPKGPTGPNLSYYRHREGCFMQMAVDDIHVFADGTIVTNCMFEEGICPIAFYGERNGEPVRLYGSEYGFLFGGRALTADDHYIYALITGGYGGPNYLCRLTRDGKKAPVNKRKSSWKVFLRKNPPGPYNRNLVPPQGIAVIDNTLYWSDSVARKIVTMDKRTLKTTGGFPLHRFSEEKADCPFKMVADGNKRLWIVQRDARDTWRVCQYTATGQWTGVQVQMPDWAPTGLAIGRIDGRRVLLISDSGAAQQVHCFSLDDQKPTYLRSYGLRGGALAGPKCGATGPGRLFFPSGVGIDAKGNIYVACNGIGHLALEDGLIHLHAQRRGQGFGATLSKFSPDGREVWRLEGLEFTDNGRVNPAQENHIYTKDSRYVVNYELATTEGIDHPSWRHAAWTIDPLRYPNDPRLHTRHEEQNVNLFHRDGRLYMVISGGRFVAVYRFDGEIAVPAFLLASDTSSQKFTAFGPWPPHHPKGTFLWHDGTGGAPADGQFQPSEYQMIDSRPWAHLGTDVDDRGNLWIVEKGQTIHYFQLENIENGLPRYRERSTLHLETLPFPPSSRFKRIKGVRYDIQTDTLYMAGQLGEATKRHFDSIAAWKGVGAVLQKQARPEQLKWCWKIAIPYMPGGKGTDYYFYAESFEVAGDYLFVGFRRLGSELPDGVPEEVFVFDLRTQRRVHILRPGPEVGYWVGDTEMPNSVSAFRRADGSYVVIEEANDYAKLIYWVWRP
ncbi:MAG: hypothetical protein D6820_12010 [Lentisphaerae bacterium]|nr:MAG: hypothetical protein D6820_12010 [Lentisphaerota bacterium]